MRFFFFGFDFKIAESPPKADKPQVLFDLNHMGRGEKELLQEPFLPFIN